MMNVQVRVGVLAEVRYRPPLRVDELPSFMAGVRNLVSQATAPLVFCTDWRGIEEFPADVADTIVWIMRRDNPRIAANAVLVSADQPAFHQQVHQMLSAASNPNRVAFDDLDALLPWIDRLLEPRERKRCREFFAEPG